MHSPLALAMGLPTPLSQVHVPVDDRWLRLVIMYNFQEDFTTASGPHKRGWLILLAWYDEVDN